MCQDVLWLAVVEFRGPLPSADLGSTEVFQRAVAASLGSKILARRKRGSFLERRSCMYVEERERERERRERERERAVEGNFPFTIALAKERERERDGDNMYLPFECSAGIVPLPFWGNAPLGTTTHSKPSRACTTLIVALQGEFSTTGSPGAARFFSLDSRSDLTVSVVLPYLLVS